MGTPIEFDNIQVGDRISILQGNSLSGSDTEDYYTIHYVGIVTRTSRSTDFLDTDFIQTESLHFSRGGTTSQYRTYELISRVEPKVKVGDTVRGDKLYTLPDKTTLSVVSGLHNGPRLRIVDAENRTLMWSSKKSFGFHLYQVNDVFRVEYVPEA